MQFTVCYECTELSFFLSWIFFFDYVIVCNSGCSALMGMYPSGHPPMQSSNCFVIMCLWLSIINYFSFIVRCWGSNDVSNIALSAAAASSGRVYDAIIISMWTIIGCCSSLTCDQGHRTHIIAIRRNDDKPTAREKPVLLSRLSTTAMNCGKTFCDGNAGLAAR